MHLRRYEGREIPLLNKLKAYALQEHGLDMIEANVALGLVVDARSYDGAVGVLQFLGVRSVALLTNNPEKVVGLQRAGIRCNTVVPMPATLNADNRDYLSTKSERRGIEDCWLVERVARPL
ncbi:hypothetical protein [Mycobacterium sp. E1747]|uniref:hypothetical protein n=1 Tax=Mycobacterium sp. E1747 TaxID=1834128 RepID=UPI0012EA1082|nr:hypothetical protein [Mycobacterium sp. E1747]